MLRRMAILGLLVASLALAKTYSFTISDPTLAGKTLLKPGDYRVKLDHSQVYLTDRDGRHIDTTATIESTSKKYPDTAVAMSKADNVYHIEYIQLGGSTNKVIFR